MTRFTAMPLAAVCALLVLSTAPARADDTPADTQAFYLEAANCAAALESRVIERQTQARTDARNEAMLRDTELGFAFVGVAYKKGLRNPEADDMLHAAEKRWALFSKTEKEARQASCSTRGRQLMDDISMLERFIVRNRASARVDRLLEKEREKERDNKP